MTLYQVAEDLAHRLASLFLRGPDDRQPVYGGTRLGVSHQRGGPGLARAMHLVAASTPEQVPTPGARAALHEVEPASPGAGRRPGG